MKKSLLFGGALLWGLCTFGQSTVVSWSFDDYTTGTSMLNADEFNANNSAAQFQFTTNLTHWLENNAGRHYADNNDDKAVVLDNWSFVPNQEKGFILPVNTIGTSGLKLNFSMFTPAAKAGPANWKIEYKIGAGDWVNVYLSNANRINPMAASSWLEYSRDLPAECEGQESLLIRVSARAPMPNMPYWAVGMGVTPPAPNSRMKFDNVSVVASVSTSLGDQLNRDDVVIYPVPVSDIVYVKLPATVKGEKVEVYNLVGSVVYQQAISGRGQDQVDLKSLSSGNYLLKVITDAGSVIKKIQVK